MRVTNPVVSGFHPDPSVCRVGADGKGHITLSLEGPKLPEVKWPAPSPRDDFDEPELGLAWNFLRWPRPQDWSLRARPGFLRLIGNATGPGSTPQPMEDRGLHLPISIGSNIAPSSWGWCDGYIAGQRALHVGESNQ